ncbi:MAG: hypothetical protein PHE73_08765 [Sulfurovaceae bacterium]|nr:hypothetical protein [Sulfurovaceae bacterium]
MNPTNDILALVQSLTGGTTSANPFAPMSQTVPYNAADFQVPDITPMIQAAYTALAPYYKQLLIEAQGDLNTALKNIQTDRDMTVRMAKQKAATDTERQQEDLTSALESLTGITFPKEKENLMDTLNKRRIAVTQTSTGELTAGTQGRGGYEVKQLSTDQQLRQEAVNRAAKRNISDISTNYQNIQEQQKQKSLEQTQSVQQAGRTTGENLSQQMQQQALGMAQNQQQQQLTQQSLNVQKKQFENIAGGGGGASGGTSGLSDTQKHINPQTKVWDDNYYANVGKYL